MEKEIRKYALHNAMQFNGTANPKSLVGKVMGAFPDARKDPKATLDIITKITEEVNSLSQEEQKAELEKTAPEMLEKKPQKNKEELKPLPDAEEGKVIMRLEPSPSGPLHIGHSYILSLNHEYVKKYNGKMYLRISDTNPENIDPEAYDMIPEDANWVCEGMIKNILIQSDRLEIYYKHTKELIEKESAYICKCTPEEFKELLSISEPCPCRKLTKEQNLERFEKMFNEYKPGDAVVRFKSDINHKNPAMRDFPLMRINDTQHPKTKDKYRVWPLMNLSVAVDDMETGVTHTLRAKDHADNALRQGMMHEVWGFKTPVAISVGRINFKGFELSTSKTRQKIEAGIYEGWDDIRIPFLRALKRRGYQPESLRKFALITGTSKTDKTVEIAEFFKTIDAFDREIIEPTAKRFFFIDDPVKIKVINAPKQDIELDLHPDNIKGGRKFSTNEDFIITKKDYGSLKEGKLSRLMDCLNYIREYEDFKFDSLEYEKYKKEGCCSIIHWLPDDDSQTIDIEILMPDNKPIKGKAEKNIESLKVGDIIQFERFGFCRLDSADNGYKFWFLHK